MADNDEKGVGEVGREIDSQPRLLVGSTETLAGSVDGGGAMGGVDVEAVFRVT